MFSKSSSLFLLLALMAGVQPAASQDAPECFLARGTAEEAAERPSPLASESTRLDGAEVKVCYGAPSARGRDVMGALVPMDQPWRAGANEATSINVAAPMEVAGVRLEPGSYSFYTIPGEDSWTVVLNSNHERWGIPINDEVRSTDIGTAEVSPEPTEEMVERLRFRFEETGENRADLIMEWENTRIRIPVQRLEE